MKKNILYNITILCIILITISCKNCLQNCKIILFGKTLCNICYTNCFESRIYQIDSCLNMRCKIQVAGECFYYSYQYSDDRKCMANCCGVEKPQNQPIIYQQYAQCLEQKLYQVNKIPQNYQKKLAIIIGCALGGVFCISVILCICFKQRIKKCWFSSQKNLRQNSFKNNAYFQSNSRQQSKNIQFILQQSDANISYDKQQQCTICLSSYNQVRSNCGHWFHLKCITQWLAKNYRCPNCNSQQINPIKVICKQCQKLYVHLNLTKKNQWKQMKKQIYGLRCKSCFQINKKQLN